MVLFGGCAAKPPFKAVDYVDLPRFMGDWWVIAQIP
jgi:apolipoprotein D and lipocalin family protein